MKPIKNKVFCIEELVDYDPVMFNITVVMKNKI